MDSKLFDILKLFEDVEVFVGVYLRTDRDDVELSPVSSSWNLNN